MIAQKHLENNHELAIIDISGIIIYNMGIKQQIIGERPNNNVTNGPPPIVGIPPLSTEWTPYDSRMGKAKSEGLYNLALLSEAIAPGVINYVVRASLQKLGDKTH